MKKFACLISSLLLVGITMCQNKSFVESENEPVVKTVSQDDMKKPEIYEYIVDTMPMFGGCEHLETYRERFACSSENLREYLSKTKPSKKTKEMEEGKKVALRFIVNEDGSLSDFEIIRSSGNTILDQIALNHMKKSPTWIPGKQNNEIVRVRMSVAVTF